MRALIGVSIALAIGLAVAIYQLAANSQALATAVNAMKVLRAQIRMLGREPDA